MGVNYNTSIVTNDLVLYVDAANTKSYPGSGTTWKDLSDNNNTATLVDGPTYNSANAGSFVFDGTNDYATISNNSFTRFAHDQPWSISMFCNPISQNTSFPGFIILGEPVSSGILIYYMASGIYWKHNNTDTFITTRELGVIKNITLAYAGSGNILAYVNGVFAQNLPAMASTNSVNSLLLGRGDQFGNVSIYNFIKYSKQLTAAEVLKNYNALRSRYGL